MTAKVFLLEGINRSDQLRHMISNEGYNLQVASNGYDAIKTLKQEYFDVCVLENNSLYVDGLTICENIRLQNNQLPILILSAKNDHEERIRVLEAGADDFISIPMESKELLLKIKRIINRDVIKEALYRKDIDQIVQFGTNTINFNTYEASTLSGKFALTPTQAELMKYFLKNRGKIISREKLLQVVWGYKNYPATRTIDNFILSLRKYFEEDSEHPKYFISRRGVGYIFTCDNIE